MNRAHIDPDVLLVVSICITTVLSIAIIAGAVTLSQTRENDRMTEAGYIWIPPSVGHWEMARPTQRQAFDCAQGATRAALVEKP